MSSMKKINVYLTVRQINALDYLAERTGIKSSEHLRRALDAYIREQAKDIREGADWFEIQTKPQTESEDTP